jgi:hypothetical protein
MTAWWSGYYGNHQLVSVSIRYLHLTAILLGGGTALFADRQVLQSLRSRTDERPAVLTVLDRAHSHVIPWMVLLGITGALMAFADTETFWASKVFWIKMSLVALLVCNGIALMILERRIHRSGITTAWNSLAFVSTLSAILWLTTLFLGTLLTVAA